jgi:hypothetical protein
MVWFERIDDKRLREIMGGAGEARQRKQASVFVTLSEDEHLVDKVHAIDSGVTTPTRA